MVGETISPVAGSCFFCPIFNNPDLVLGCHFILESVMRRLVCQSRELFPSVLPEKSILSIVDFLEAIFLD